MNKRVLAQSCAAGALILGAAGALSGCAGGSTGSGPAHTAAGAAQSTTQNTAQSTGTAATTSPSAEPVADVTSDSNQGSSGRSGTPACADGQISEKYVKGDVGLGHRSAIIVFTDNGSGACTLSGYPGAGVTDQPGKVVLNAQRSLVGYLSGTTAITTVTLQPGGQASAMLEWDAAPAGGQETPVGANCPGMYGGKLLVTPPNTRISTAFAAPADLCTDFYVHPVVPGTTGVTRD